MFANFCRWMTCLFLLAAAQPPPSQPAQPKPQTKPDTAGTAKPTPPPADKATSPPQPSANKPAPPTPPPADRSGTATADAPVYTVTAYPNPCLPGQTVTFYPPADAEKILVHGGRFATPTPWILAQPLTDVPSRPTVYVFDVWYSKRRAAPAVPTPSSSSASGPTASHAPSPEGATDHAADHLGEPPKSPDAATGKPKEATAGGSAPTPLVSGGPTPQSPGSAGQPKSSAGAQPPGSGAAAKAATPPTAGAPVAAASTASASAVPEPPEGHQRIKVAVDVYSGKFPRLATYRDPHLWHIDVLAGWNRNVVPRSDPAHEALVYFQPQEDSAERVAVAIQPMPHTTSAELMHKAMDDAPTQYDVLKDVQQKETTQCGVTAQWVTFTGLDRALPDVPVRAVVVAFVRNGEGYVISARAQEAMYDQWEKPLRCLVRSFGFDAKTAERSAPEQQSPYTMRESPGHRANSGRSTSRQTKEDPGGRSGAGTSGSRASHTR
jgi:hypothetical protein